MELRSDLLIRTQSPLGSRRRRRPLRCPDDGGADRISALPDDLLLQILVRLRCARAAALTSALSRRWRGLWRHLPELSFRDIPSDALDAALDQVAGPAVSRLEIDIPEKYRIMDPARVSALLHVAARLAPVDLVFSVWGHCKDLDIAIEIPCFDRATSIKLDVFNLYLTPPAGGVQFPVLERLSIAGCFFDMDELTRRCPCLRVLEVCCLPCNIGVHSPTIEELVVDAIGWLSNIDIVAPVLKRVELSTKLGQDFSVPFSAPTVEDLSWFFSYDYRNVGIGEIWRLRDLTLSTQESVYVLKLYIDTVEYAGAADRSFSQEIAPLPAFSVLQLHLAKRKHVFGAMVSNLLGICSTIQRLKVAGRQFWDYEACPPNCPCDQPDDWRSQNISLTALEEVEIEGFGGTNHEVDFLKLLFRCATLMKTMTVTLFSDVLPSNIGCKAIYSIFEANPDVKCYVYRSCGKQVLYA